MDDGRRHRFDTLHDAAVGVDPRAQAVVPADAPLDEQGNLVTESHCRANVDKLCAAGDVVGALDRISVACGQAALAATTVRNILLAAAA